MCSVREISIELNLMAVSLGGDYKRPSLGGKEGRGVVGRAHHTRTLLVGMAHPTPESPL